MPLLLILEDARTELRKAVDLAQSVGFTEFEVSAYPSVAQTYLKNAMAGKVPLPDAMVIDLDLGVESGFELLRFWHSAPQLRLIPAIVWSVTRSPEHQQEICGFFGVHRFVRKDDDLNVFREALASVFDSRVR